MQNQAYVAQTPAHSPQCQLHAIWQVCADASYRVNRPEKARDTLVAVRTVAGCGTVVTERNVVLAPAQSLVVFQGNAIKQYATTHQDWDFFWFEFDWVGGMGLTLERVYALPMEKSESLYLSECRRSLIQTGHKQAQYGAAMFAALLSYWISNTDIGGDGERLLFQQILYEINAGLKKHLTVSGLAQAHHMSDRTLRNIFYRQAGQSPLQVIRDCRLHAAREMLDSTDLLVKEVGAQVGFSNAFYFSREFKEKYGISPLQYRAEKRGTLPHDALGL